MATAEVCSCKTEDDITTCTICLERFNIPKYLPCLHSFCQSCIEIYITSAFEKDKTWFNCPVCRSKVFAPESGITPEQWTRRLPLNFLLVGLIEKHKVERPEKICMSCERIDVNKKSKAIAVCIDCSDTLCSNCLSCHRINKSSSDHEIVDILKRGIVLKSFKNMCTEHKSKELELFCADHDLPCCSTCVSVAHRKCEKVLTIEDAAETFRETTSVDMIKNDIRALISDIDSLVHLERVALKHLEEVNISQLKTYNDFWTNVQKQIDLMKINQTKQCQKMFDEEKTHLDSSISNLESKKKTLSNTQQILDVTVKEASDIQVMIEVRKVKKQIDQHLVSLQRKNTFCEIDFRFKKRADEVYTMLENICEINCREKSKSLEFCSLKAEKTGINPSSFEFQDQKTVNEGEKRTVVDGRYKKQVERQSDQEKVSDSSQEKYAYKQQEKVHAWDQGKVSDSCQKRVAYKQQEEVHAWDQGKISDSCQKKVAYKQEEEVHGWDQGKMSDSCQKKDAYKQREEVHSWNQRKKSDSCQEKVAYKQQEEVHGWNQGNMSDSCQKKVAYKQQEEVHGWDQENESDSCQKKVAYKQQEEVHAWDQEKVQGSCQKKVVNKQRKRLHAWDNEKISESCNEKVADNQKSKVHALDQEKEPGSCQKKVVNEQRERLRAWDNEKISESCNEKVADNQKSKVHAWDQEKVPGSCQKKVVNEQRERLHAWDNEKISESCNEKVADNQKCMP